MIEQKGGRVFTSSLDAIAAYNNTFVYTHLGQLWKGPINGGSTQDNDAGVQEDYRTKKKQYLLLFASLPSLYPFLSMPY